MFLAQYKVLRENGHSPSEAFNETVEEATQSLFPLIGQYGMDYMYNGACFLLMISPCSVRGRSSIARTIADELVALPLPPSSASPSSSFPLHLPPSSRSLLDYCSPRCPRLGPDLRGRQQAGLREALRLGPRRLRDSPLARVQRPAELPRGVRQGDPGDRQPVRALVAAELGTEADHVCLLLSPSSPLPSPVLAPPTPSVLLTSQQRNMACGQDGAQAEAGLQGRRVEGLCRRRHLVTPHLPLCRSCPVVLPHLAVPRCSQSLCLRCTAKRCRICTSCRARGRTLESKGPLEPLPRRPSVAARPQYVSCVPCE